MMMAKRMSKITTLDCKGGLQHALPQRARITVRKSLVRAIQDENEIETVKEQEQEVTNSETEFNEAVASGSPASMSQGASEPQKWYDPNREGLQYGELMAFSGPAPELINGRLAMLAFIAAFGGELGSGQTVWSQFASDPAIIIMTISMFSVATLIPLLVSTEREAFGPFTAEAETLNGRAAMIGFAALLAIEMFKGSALF
jgi:hypothetical protein